LRPLNDSEITTLQNQGCISSNWSGIKVSDSFSSREIQNVRFEGDIKLGNLGSTIETNDGVKKVSGLFNCQINNCEIGNDVLINNVHQIRNYRIGDNAVIENVNTISVNGTSSFGNGFEIDVLNEGGGRELLIFDRLSAQLAYILVCYRHEPGMIAAINQMIKDYALAKSSEIGNIETGAQILNSGSLINVNIGEYANVSGASLLENGTIASHHDAPVYIGENVVARNFIILSGSVVDGGALVEKTFIGQAVQLGKQFSAENSVFFANTEAFHGEAVSIFAGPYTVTHHKSTLLIAGMYSFFNAGSGTNQSNHMYKLGPVHQGIVERGSKTGSFAYLLWPSRVGAYSAVIGKNLSNFDTSDFPFSYINVDNDKSFLTPGMNLLTVGTRRDSEKWPDRDKRSDPDKLDLINFDLLSPYIIERVTRGLMILKDLYEKTPKKQESVLHKGVRIKRLMLKSTQKYYELALSVFVGNQIINKLEEIDEIDSIEKVREHLSVANDDIPEKWYDLAGLVAPDNAVNSFISDIKSGGIKTLDEISLRLKTVHASYARYAWAWTTRLLSDRYQIDVSKIETEQLVEWVTNWESGSNRLNKMILSDAGKEFDKLSKIGYGIDGNEEIVSKDFESVRGNPEDNKFIMGITEMIKGIEEKAGHLKNILKLI